MKYRILLTNVANGAGTEIIVPANMPLEELSIKIKLAMDLQLCDNGWHRFFIRGTAYVSSLTFIAEQEILYECDLYVGRYRHSEDIRLKQAFTTLNSVITYEQDASEFTIYKIRCTLLERI